MGKRLTLNDPRLSGIIPRRMHRVQPQPGNRSSTSTRRCELSDIPGQPCSTTARRLRTVHSRRGADHRIGAKSTEFGSRRGKIRRLFFGSGDDRRNFRHCGRTAETVRMMGKTRSDGGIQTPLHRVPGVSGGRRIDQSGRRIGSWQFQRKASAFADFAFHADPSLV